MPNKIIKKRKLNKYIDYLLYILEHKYNVFKIAFRKGHYLHAFTHDLSKFSPSEFFGYAKYFYEDKTKNELKFSYCWLHHHHYNKHHWDYWVNGDGSVVEIPRKYLE